MRRVVCVIMAILAVLLACDATARLRSSFRLQEAAWKADHIVLVRVGSTFEVLESWAGDLAPGSRLEMRGVRSITQAEYDEWRHRHRDIVDPGPSGGIYIGPEWAHGKRVREPELQLVEGAHAVLFLKEKGETTEATAEPSQKDKTPPRTFAVLLPERSREFTFQAWLGEKIPGGVAWYCQGQVFALEQTVNPGWPRPWPQREWHEATQEWAPRTAKSFDAEVKRVATLRREFDITVAKTEPEELANALRRFSGKGVGPADEAVRKVLAEQAGGAE